MAGLAPSDIDRRIAARVQAARKVARITQRDAGAILGVSGAQFQKYEQGANRLTGGMLQTLADLFGLPVARLFDPIEDGETDLGSILGAAQRAFDARRGRPRAHGSEAGT